MVHGVPAVREVDLSQVLVEEINRVIGQAPTGPFDEHEFWNVFHTVIRPLFRNVRDVRRYADALPMTLQVIGDEVRLTDVLALEAPPRSGLVAQRQREGHAGRSCSGAPPPPFVSSSAHARRILV